MCDVSVIIPVFNTDRYLPECLDSVLSQKGISLEILLVDDGSTDKSIRIIKKYATNHPNVRFYLKKHMGVGAARNYGIKRAKGKYLMFLDSDDYLLPDALSALFHKAEEVHADLVIGNYRYLYGQKEQAASPSLRERTYLAKDILHLSCIGGNKLYLSEIIQDYRIRFPSLKMGEDLCFYHEYLSKVLHALTIEEDIFVYRMHEGSTSKTYDLRIFDFFKAFQLIEEVYRDQPYMKKEFTYDEMFYLYGNLKRLPRYPDKQDRIVLFDALQKEAGRHRDVTPEAAILKKRIMKMNKWLYCGTLPVFVHSHLRKVIHMLYKR